MNTGPDQTYPSVQYYQSKGVYHGGRQLNGWSTQRQFSDTPPQKILSWIRRSLERMEYGVEKCADFDEQIANVEARRHFRISLQGKYDQQQMNGSAVTVLLRIIVDG